MSLMLTSGPPLKDTIKKMLITGNRLTSSLEKTTTDRINLLKDLNGSINSQSCSGLLLMMILADIIARYLFLQEYHLIYKSTMTEFYQAFKGRLQPTPQAVLPLKHMPITERPTNVGGRLTYGDMKKPPSYTGGALSAFKKLKMLINRFKPEPITDVKIHPNSKPAILTVYRNNDKKNFDVHSPFKFGDFEIIELDELGPIIEKKKNSIIKELMTSLGKRYED
ncbi:hypothetical protein Tco_0583037 [Tanacetum coccineum]